MPKQPCIDIVYAAHTASCTFLLDGEGICRRIVMAPKGKRREGSRTASRCVGAQYVASLDGKAAGGLVEMPRVGAAMLFARVDERGRVSLVRTGIVTTFESEAAEDPFAADTFTGSNVETSAPKLPPAAPSARASVTPPTARSAEHTPRTVRMPTRPPLPLPSELDADADADTYADGDRTQRIQALRDEDIAEALGASRPAAAEAQGVDFTTSEYRSIHDDEDDHRPTLVPTPKAGRGMLPRGASDPRAAAARAYAPEQPASDVQVSRRHRR